MKLKSIIALTLGITLTFGLTACKKDKEKPTVSVSEPVEHSTFKWGETVHIDAEFADDRDLKHYHVFIGDMAGNHNHDFDFMKSEDISGESYHFHKHFVVPDTAPEMAWVHFEVKDAEDKVTELKWMLHFEE